MARRVNVSPRGPTPRIVPPTPNLVEVTFGACPADPSKLERGKGRFGGAGLDSGEDSGTVTSFEAPSCSGLRGETTELISHKCILDTCTKYRRRVLVEAASLRRPREQLHGHAPRLASSPYISGVGVIAESIVLQQSNSQAKVAGQSEGTLGKQRVALAQDAVRSGPGDCHNGETRKSDGADLG
ncbi:hypothetical protein OIDMADRAFT_145929 [Oidiodendron maius Zn]|uniref:Uncharacterized protein n=1 Tax=Oidiodendron maius (strain Zn) TaxID=913774 RepID=A0A0C3DER9_OIDMZ|nr:hypothetical protein OIDMADRAFT_145929 [Oidiodendron maius Zn]